MKHDVIDAADSEIVYVIGCWEGRSQRQLWYSHESAQNAPKERCMGNRLRICSNHIVLFIAQVDVARSETSKDILHHRYL